MKPNSPVPIITYQLWYFQWRWFSPLQVPSNSQRLTKGTASTVTSSQPRKFRRPPRPRPSQLRSRGPMVEARIVSPVPSLWCSLSWFLSNPAYDCLPHSVYHVHFENHKVTWVACPFSSRTFNSVHIFISPPALVSAWVSSSNNALYVEPKLLYVEPKLCRSCQFPLIFMRTLRFKIPRTFHENMPTKSDMLTTLWP